MTFYPDPTHNPLHFPFERPSTSFVLASGEIQPPSSVSALKEGRVSVVAYAHWATPEFLKSIFTDDVVFIQRGRLTDHDVVFAAALSPNLLPTASLRHIANTVVEVAVLWLTETQLRKVKAVALREFAHLVMLEHIPLALDDGSYLPNTASIVSTANHVSFDGRAVAISGVSASWRLYPTMSSNELFAKIATLLGRDGDVVTLLQELRFDTGLMHRVTTILSKNSIEPNEWAFIRLHGAHTDNSHRKEPS